MPFKHLDGLKFFYFDTLDLPGITHGVATRIGGESQPPWASLNVGGTVGDTPEIVAKNLVRIFKALGLDPTSKHDVWQIHSSEAKIVEFPLGSAEPEKADILITKQKNITLLMRFADCVPILLYDPVTQVISLVHAGRIGMLKGAPKETMRVLIESFGVDPQNVIAGIGPSICPDCYEVGPEIYSEFSDRMDPGELSTYFHTVDGKYHLDLWTCAESQLRNMGVEQIEISRICTADNISDWFSHRGENGRTGRFAALLCMNG